MKNDRMMQALRKRTIEWLNTIARWRIGRRFNEAHWMVVLSISKTCLHVWPQQYGKRRNGGFPREFINKNTTSRATQNSQLNLPRAASTSSRCGFCFGFNFDQIHESVKRSERLLLYGFNACGFFFIYCIPDYNIWKKYNKQHKNTNLTYIK